MGDRETKSRKVVRNAECGIKKKLFLTPLGWAGVAVSAQGITRIVLPKKSKKAAERELISAECGNLHTRLRAERRAQGVQSAERKDAAGISSLQILNRSVQLLQAYYSGENVTFDLPLDIRYHTPFQQAVWQAAAKIPYGETRPYVWIAERIRKPKAARAVGQAMGANPFPVIIP